METKSLFNSVSVSLLIILTAIIAALFYFEMISLMVGVPALIISILISSSIHIADQWEKAVVLRMGKFIGLKRARILSDHTNH